MHFHFWGLAFRKSNCWMPNKQVGSKNGAPEAQMARLAPEPQHFAGAAALAPTFLHLSELTAPPKMMVLAPD